MIAEKKKFKADFQGEVVSISGDKSIVVKIERKSRHPLYGKIMYSHKKFHAHDEANISEVGDVVSITASRPLSRLKRWKLVKVLSKLSDKA